MLGLYKRKVEREKCREKKTGQERKEKLKEGHVPEPAPVTIAVFPFTLKG